MRLQVRLCSALLIIALLTSCGGNEPTDAAEANPFLPSEGPTIEASITPYTGSNPLDQVNTFIGTVFKDTDPDVQWIAETKSKLDAMKAEEYLSSEEYSQIVQRQTAIQYKYDTRRAAYDLLEHEQKAIILPHAAMEFLLESFCLNMRLKSPSSGSVYDKVTPQEAHLKQMLTWYYTIGKQSLNSTTFQYFIWGVQDFVHNGYSYNAAFSSQEKEYLQQIFGENPDAHSADVGQ